jgi:hypothetical protein
LSGNVREVQDKCAAWFSSSTINYGKPHDALLPRASQLLPQDPVLHHDSQQGIDLECINDDASRHYLEQAL